MALLSSTIEALKQAASESAAPSPPDEQQLHDEGGSVADAMREDTDDQEQLHPLSDDDDIDNEALKSTTSTNAQRRGWLIRHSGSTHLTCDIFLKSEKSVADHCISIQDDNGYYTTYVHLDEKVRTIDMKRMLSDAANIIAFKIVHFHIQIQNSRHFWKLAAAIQQKHGSLKMERTNPHNTKSLFSSFMK